MVTKAASKVHKITQCRNEPVGPSAGSAGVIA